MRRIATGLIVLAALCGGCSSVSTPWGRPQLVPTERPVDEPEVRTKQDAVPDSVMLRDQARGGFTDSPVGP